jgi:hypothetical protein
MVDKSMKRKYSEKMKRIIFILIMGLIFLCCCTTKYSKPYSAKKVASVLGKYFDTEIEVIDERIVKPPPMGRNSYIMKDKIHGFEFTADIYLEDTHLFGFTRIIDDNYQTALMLHFSESAKMLADSYGIKLITVNNIQEKPLDRIYLYEPDQLVGASKLYFRLKNLYGFDQKRKYNMHVLNDPEYAVYYLEKNNQNINEAVSILPLSDFDGFDYVIYGDIENNDYRRNEETFLIHLSAWWNDAYRQGKIPVTKHYTDLVKLLRAEY